MPSNTDYASSPSATSANPPTPTSNAKTAAPASTPKPSSPATSALETLNNLDEVLSQASKPAAPSRFRDECVILALLPNGTIHPVIHPPTQRGKVPPGVRIFEDTEAAIVEMSTGRLANLKCAVVQLKDLFD